MTQSHTPLASLGRSWKVCWVADAVDVGCPAVTRGAPGSHTHPGVAAAAAADAPAPVEAAIRAVVGVAKSRRRRRVKAALTATPISSHSSAVNRRMRPRR